MIESWRKSILVELLLFTFNITASISTPSYFERCFRRRSNAVAIKLAQRAEADKQDGNVAWRALWDQAFIDRANNFGCEFEPTRESPQRSSPNLTLEFLDRFILVPEHKLLFCWIDKVGSEAFNRLFRDLRWVLNSTHPNSPFVINTNMSSWRHNRAIEDHGVAGSVGLSNLLQDPSWHKAVFFRGGASCCTHTNNTTSTFPSKLIVLIICVGRST
jgi:hypothetical protein